MIVTLTVVPAIDLVYEVERCTESHGPFIAQAKSREWYAAGKGINVARGVRQLGGKVYALSLGGGAAGRLLQRMLDDEGIPGTVLDTTTTVRINATIVGAGNEIHIVEPSRPPSAQDLVALQARALGHVGAGDVLVIAGHCPLPHGPAWLVAFIAAMRLRGIRTAVDTRDEALSLATTDARPWLFKPNMDELSRAMGVLLRTDADVLRATSAIRQRSGADIVMTSMGERGALIVTAGGAWRGHVPKLRAVNTVGAGDAMLAAAAMMADAPPRELLRHALAAGSAKVGVQAPGAIPLEAFQRLLGQVRIEPADPT